MHVRGTICGRQGSLKTPKKRPKRLSLRKIVKKPEKRCPSVEKRTVNEKNQKKIRKNVEKAKKKA